MNYQGFNSQHMQQHSQNEQMPIPPPGMEGMKPYVGYPQVPQQQQAPQFRQDLRQPISGQYMNYYNYSLPYASTNSVHGNMQQQGYMHRQQPLHTQMLMQQHQQLQMRFPPVMGGNAPPIPGRDERNGSLNMEGGDEGEERVGESEVVEKNEEAAVDVEEEGDPSEKSAKKKKEAPKPVVNYKHTVERGTFGLEIAKLLYGFGDSNTPDENTVEILEDLLVDYVVETVRAAQRVLQISKRDKIVVDDLLFAIRHDERKFGRGKELILMQKVIKNSRNVKYA